MNKTFFYYFFIISFSLTSSLFVQSKELTDKLNQPVPLPMWFKGSNQVFNEDGVLSESKNNYKL
jgi:hypothetical protein